MQSFHIFYYHNKCSVLKLCNAIVAIKSYCHDTCTYVREDCDFYYYCKIPFKKILLMSTFFSLRSSATFKVLFEIVRKRNKKEEKDEDEGK